MKMRFALVRYFKNGLFGKADINACEVKPSYIYFDS